MHTHTLLFYKYLVWNKCCADFVQPHFHTDYFAAHKFILQQMLFSSLFFLVFFFLLLIHFQNYIKLRKHGSAHSCISKRTDSRLTLKLICSMHMLFCLLRKKQSKLSEAQEEKRERAHQCWCSGDAGDAYSFNIYIQNTMSSIDIYKAHFVIIYSTTFNGHFKIHQFCESWQFFFGSNVMYNLPSTGNPSLY